MKWYIVLGRIIWILRWCIAFRHTVRIFKKTHCIQTYSMDFRRIHCILSYSAYFLKEYTIFGHIVQIFEDILHSHIQYDFLKIYCTRTYNMIFERILYSDIHYKFWEFTALGHTVWFLKKYCTRAYNMIFKDSLYSDV